MGCPNQLLFLHVTSPFPLLVHLLMGLAYTLETPLTSPRKTLIMFLPGLYKKKMLLSHLLYLPYGNVSHPLITEIS